MNEVKLFENEEFGLVRTVIIDGEPWFVGKDVAMALGYSKTNDAIKTNVNNEDTTTVGVLDANNHTQQMIAINESGLYDLVFESGLPSAKGFRRWVTSEVLPSIRKNGGYISGQETLSDDELLEKALIVARNKIADRDKLIAEQEIQILEMKPKAQLCDKLIDAKLLVNFRDAAKEIGISQSQFTGWLKENGYVYSNSAEELRPMEPYMESGLFQMKPYQNPYNGYTGSRAYITGRGLAAFKTLIDDEGHSRYTMKKHGGRGKRKA